MKKDTRIGSWRKPMRNGSLSGLPLSVSAFLVIPVLLMLLGITACNGFSRAEEDSYFLYYIDAEENSILQVAYEPENAQGFGTIWPPASQGSKYYELRPAGGNLDPEPE